MRERERAREEEEKYAAVRRYEDGPRHVLFVSTRRRFRRGDPNWDSYAASIGLPELNEVRTVDAALNEYVDRCGSLYCAPSQVATVLAMLPKPAANREYYLLGVSPESDALSASFNGFDFLGCDLSDDTMTSSLLNCGPWKGLLQPFVLRLNCYGLLSLADAREAQPLLLAEWGTSQPHARANIWALFGKAV